MGGSGTTITKDRKNHSWNLDSWPTKTYGQQRDVLPIPNLIELQIKSYGDFLQYEAPPDNRKLQGLEGILRESFPIESFDGRLELQYLYHEFGKPRYTPEECRRLRLSYGVPFKLRLRVVHREGGETVDEDVYLGELPLMIGGGEFIINGAERVIVSQLHRSPGIDFGKEIHAGKRLHSFWIIPERGSWIECNVSKKENLTVRIDQSGKLPATLLLRAMNEKYSTDVDIVRHFYDTQVVDLTKGKRSQKKLIDKLLVGAIYEEDAEEPYADTGTVITAPDKSCRKESSWD